MITWPAKYVGIPFAEHGRDAFGCDCWGLVRMVYRDQLDIELPDFCDGYRDTRDGEAIAALSRAERERWLAVSNPQPFDVISLRVRGLPWHVGVVADRGRMLHVLRGCDAVVESYERPLWSQRIEGFYRWIN
jgi:cell wall-associated NlpC family hydrolase